MQRGPKLISVEQTWLLVLCGMVFIMVVLGGVTRLTESGTTCQVSTFQCRYFCSSSAHLLLKGLSITEWKPIVGAIPPLSDADWEVEFAKYKKSPEYIKYDNFDVIVRLIGAALGCTLT